MRILDKQTYFVTIQGESLEVHLEPEEGHAIVTIGDQSFNIAGDYKPGKGIQEFLVNGEVMRFRMENQQERLVLARRGVEVKTRAMSKLEHDLYEMMPEKTPVDTSNLIVSPMPGKVIKLYVKPGDSLKVGGEVCVLEAMKMENVLIAETECVVEEVLIKEGDTVDSDQLLVRLTAHEEKA